MGKFYVVIGSYAPNTAATNRIVGMLNRLSERSIQTEVVIFTSAVSSSELPSIPYISYRCYYDYLHIKNSKIQLFLYLMLYSLLFSLTLKKGDIIYVYGCDRLVNIITNKKDISVYVERTEHPEVVRLKYTNMTKYYESCKKLSGMFVISTALKKLFIEKGVDKDRVHLINMTVDPNRFTGIVKNVKERIIAYCGNANNNKDGVDQLIKAFYLLSDSFKEVKLMIIGRPPRQDTVENNMKLVKDLQLDNRVVFTGEVPSSEIPQLLVNAEVLALNRPDNIQAQYGFPTKLGEYLLSKNPVVITKVGDIPLFFKDGENAFLSDADNPEMFSKKLEEALSNNEYVRSVGLAGYNTALTEFNSSYETDKIIRVIFGGAK